MGRCLESERKRCPCLIVEVLSDATEAYDRELKFAYNRQLSSVQEYVLVSQESSLVERFVGQPDESWQYTAFSGLSVRHKGD
jgi:Uma2 family endonuclease